MKKYTALLLLFVCCHAFAQTYPFAEGFEGQPNNQPPAGWGGSMKVQSNHGIGDLKAVCARISSAVTTDSTITPLIGPLTNASALSFSYRAIDQAIYPSTPTDFDTGDEILVLLSTDNVNYDDTILLIDMNNHNSSFNFAKRKVFLSQYAGNTVNFKIRCNFGSGAGYYVDFDTLVVKNDPQIGIEDLADEETFSLSPNPCAANLGCLLQFKGAKPLPVNVFNFIGQKIVSVQAAVNCQLPTANWQPGIYFVQSGNHTRKLIVE